MAKKKKASRKTTAKKSYRKPDGFSLGSDELDGVVGGSLPIGCRQGHGYHPHFPDYPVLPPECVTGRGAKKGCRSGAFPDVACELGM